MLGTEFLAIGDLILVEVLQGFSNGKDFTTAKSLLSSLFVVDLCGETLALEAANNYRFLRNSGITVRKTIDTIIATRCIVSSIPLLHNDRDFEPFVTHFGLRSIC